MQRFFLIFLIFLSGTFFSYAQVAPEQTELHLVKKGETLYHLSQIYNTTVSHLLDLNPVIVDNKLKTGASVKVPKAPAEVALKKVKIGPPHFLNPIIYKVGKGETLYSISKKSNTEVETVRMWNDLKSDDIKAGQKIIVGYTGSDTDPKTTNTGTTASATTTEPATAAKVAATTTSSAKAKPTAEVATTKEKSKPVTTTTPAPVVKTQAQPTVAQTAVAPVKAAPAKTTATTTVTANTKTPATLTPATPVGTPVPTKYEVNANRENGKLTYLSEKGVATWSKGNNDDGQFYALHPTAPVGTIITVKNMMNSSSVQVKVIGKLPNTAENQNVMIKLSGSAAKQLNVLDDKFLATINYMGYKPEATSMK